jgi:hypothetical protein
MTYTDEDKRQLLVRHKIDPEDMSARLLRYLYAVIDDAFEAGRSHVSGKIAHEVYDGFAAQIPSQGRPLAQSSSQEKRLAIQTEQVRDRTAEDDDPALDPLHNSDPSTAKSPIDDDVQAP